MDDISTVILDHRQLTEVVKPAFLTLAAAGAAEQSVEKTEHLHLWGEIPAEMDPLQQPDLRHQLVHTFPTRRTHSRDTGPGGGAAAGKANDSDPEGWL